MAYNKLYRKYSAVVDTSGAYDKPSQPMTSPLSPPQMQPQLL